MNQPYVKVYNENGVLTNPIEGVLKTQFPNRRARRHSEPRFRGNHKGASLTVTGIAAYHRVVQVVDDKRIEHYLPKDEPKTKRR